MAVVRKIKTKVIDIIEYSADIRFYKLETSNKNFDFKCGQFLQLAVDEYDASYPWPESRCFSIISSPGNKDYIDILVSRKGNFTTRMFNELALNDTIWVKLPYGDFNFESENNKELFFIAGGTGISPFISYLRLLLESEMKNKVNLYYGVKETGLLIFTDLFDELKLKYDDINIHLYVENLTTPDSSSLMKGILPVNDITGYIINKYDSSVYLSGPPVMINSFNKSLIEKGFSENKIHFDKWE